MSAIRAAATLPYASVSISNVATGVVTSVVTNADGLYSAPNLLPGTYEVTATFDGFNTQTKSGITLTVGAELPIDFADVGRQGQRERPGVGGRRRESTRCRPRFATTSAAPPSASCR